MTAATSESSNIVSSFSQQQKTRLAEAGRVEVGRLSFTRASVVPNLVGIIINGADRFVGHCGSISQPVPERTMAEFEPIPRTDVADVC
jgi:hypothetical protein